jgi:drug/metabolite transporter (DMT)-like permease
VLRVIAVAVPTGWVVTLALLPVLGGTFSPAAVAWGAASGVASSAAFALLYRCLAIGPMVLLSPVAAVISALLPVGVGLTGGERLSAPAGAGVALAVLAVVLICAGQGDTAARGGTVVSARGLRNALGAGVAIAGQLLCLDAAPRSSGLAPLIAAGAVSTLVVLVALAMTRPGTGTAQERLWLALLAGALGGAANVALLGAVRRGDLSVVAVVTALYPASTVLLARTVLRERVAGSQAVGLGLAAVAVVAFSRG